VSSGPEERPVPDVTGKTLAEASNLLGQNGFTAKQTSEPSNTVEEGRVIRTDPPAGTLQPKGAEVTVVVSSGPQKVEVPDVVGLTENGARTALQRQGLTMGSSTTPECTPDQQNQVISQNPDAGTKVDPGSQVTVLICQPVVDGGGGGGGPN
jgi:serine/threonine-protein kinase